MTVVPERDANQLAAAALPDGMRERLESALADDGTASWPQPWVSLDVSDVQALVGLVGTLQGRVYALETSLPENYMEAMRDLEAQVGTLQQERDEALGKWSDSLAGERNAETWMREAKARAVAAEAALAWYDDHKRDDGSYDGEMWGDLRALADTGGDTA